MRRTPQVQTVTWDVVRNNPYAAVPEPTTMLLLPAGFALLARRRRNDATVS